MTDLRSHYLGLELRSPLVAAPSPLTLELDGLRRLEDAGAGAAVLGSLFEEHIRADRAAFYTRQGVFEEPDGTPVDLPESQRPSVRPHEYLELIRRAKESLGMPVIASINTGSIGGWVQYADLIEKAGADALELNIYGVAADADCSASEVEQQVVDIVGAVRLATGLPLAVKLTPFYSSLAHLARRLVAAGANGLVLFNRFI